MENNEENTDAIDPTEPESESQFEMTPEQATGFGGPDAEQSPGQFNRKRVLMTICVAFAVFVGGGLLFNIASSSSKKKAATEAEISAADTPSDLLRSLHSRALNRREAEPEQQDAPPPEVKPETTAEPLLPPVSVARSQEVEMVRNYPPPQGSAPPAPQSSQSGNNAGPPPEFRSPLVPPVEGSLFSGSRAVPQPASSNAPQRSSYDNAAAEQIAALNAARGGASGTASEYAAQNNQSDKQNFYDSSSGGAVMNGRFLGGNSIWIGTIIPGILETAINTDLPGNVIARVTQHIYDSQTGAALLVPQGTILVAKYNSSVSYAQHRVQIVWDTLIRPDGFQLDLDGMNSVDRTGMSGQGAVYHENWFEYLKAAGIVTLFSIANSSMTETAAKYASNTSASAIASSNSELVNQLGGNLVGRAMNIQPTLTVANGTLINVMLNKTLYLPPVDNYPTTQKYTLE